MRKLWLELANERLSELELAQWTVLLAPAPDKNALAVKEVAHVARQRDNFLTKLEALHAEGALFMRCKYTHVVFALVERQHTQL